jgi:hypothetical protein
MMLQNLVTGLNLLSDLSVGSTSDLLQRSVPLSVLSRKPNLDRCALKTEGMGPQPPLDSSPSPDTYDGRAHSLC